MRLTKGLYPERGPAGLFGLRNGRIRGAELAHNSGWYNALGEKLGWGDLAAGDFRAIAAGLEPDEVFLVLPESASLWDFQKSSAEKLDLFAPGIEYVLARASWAVFPGVVVRVPKFDDPAPTPESFDGLDCSRCGRSWLRAEFERRNARPR